MAKLKLGIVVGSNRRESINRKLAQALAKFGSDKFEAKFIQIDDLPIYNQDHRAAGPRPGRPAQGRGRGRRRIVVRHPRA